VDADDIFVASSSFAGSAKRGKVEAASQFVVEIL
jgi:hypothetical protein